MDALNKALEPLTSFVLPGGTEAAARVHLARTAARRAERAMTALAEAEPVNPAALAYINRLSDYLFVLARVANDGGRRDILWKPGAEPLARQRPVLLRPMLHLRRSVFMSMTIGIIGAGQMGSGIAQVGRRQRAGRGAGRPRVCRSPRRARRASPSASRGWSKRTR